eukprot:16224-Heterococcus_DN1.PRE.1
MSPPSTMPRSIVTPLSGMLNGSRLFSRCPTAWSATVRTSTSISRKTSTKACVRAQQSSRNVSACLRTGKVQTCTG